MSAPAPPPDCGLQTPAWHADTLADSVVILLVWTVVQRAIGFVRAALFCRWMDPAVLGQWDMAFGFLMLAAPASVLALASSLGRYVEHYWQRRQLRALLVRTAVATGLLACASALAIASVPRWFSRLIFNSPDRAGLVWLVAGTLPALVAFHYFINLLNALRSVRLLTALQALNSVAFAGLGILLVLWWDATARSAIVAFAAANAISAACGVAWLAGRWRFLPAEGPPPSHRELWSKLVPFAASVWMASLLANLFDLADRYVIVHWLPGTPEETLAQAGNYHTSRVLPLVLVSIAALVSPMITPHLSRDWEEGRRGRVSMRLNLYVKLAGLGMSIGAVAVLLAAPLLFGVVFQGKFSGGLAVLPGTLTYCTWFGMAMVAQNYLWCAEKARLGSLALAVGLSVKVGLSLWLVPEMGLAGAVVAAGVAHLTALVLILYFGRALGLRADLGTWVVLAVPVLFCLGPWASAVVLIGLLAQSLATDRIFGAEEKAHLRSAWFRYRATFQRFSAALSWKR
jgi:O-antigen/teichoic acid export membrane protein